jgi:hypothetical protein
MSGHEYASLCRTARLLMIRYCCLSRSEVKACWLAYVVEAVFFCLSARSGVVWLIRLFFSPHVATLLGALPDEIDNHLIMISALLYDEAKRSLCFCAFGGCVEVYAYVS